MSAFGKYFKQGKGKAVEASATKVTVPITTDEKITPTAIPLDQKLELYSTEGDIGISDVANPADASLDIVFVHGLTGNRNTTWTHKNGFFWPKQMAEDIAREGINTARVMVFGYDADVTKLWGIAGSNNLRNHGKNLAFAISDRRRSCRERPIIFIAHSLGGLVCEQALLICRENGENLEKVAISTRGIIFMGTPHSGSDLANWGYTLAKYLDIVWHANSAILDTLRQKSEVLTAVQQQFQQSILKPNISIKIYCFFEEKDVFGVGTIVPEYSAVLSQYPNQSIPANHMDMTKFSGRNDVGYQRVLGRVLDNIESIGFFNPGKKPDQEVSVAQTSGRVGFTPLARLERLSVDEKARLGRRLLEVGREILHTYENNDFQTHEHIWRPPIAKLSQEFDLSFPYHAPGTWEGHVCSESPGIQHDPNRNVSERFNALGCYTAAMMNNQDMLTLRFLYYQAMHELMVYCGVDKEK